MAEPLRLVDLATSVSDGVAVDWVAERRRARDPGELRIVEALASLDGIATALRSSGPAPAPATDEVTREDVDTFVGRVIGPYRIEEFVGRGGMGRVYRARDTRLDRPVAIKLLAPELAADDAASRRFLRETRLACRVSHPYVAVVHDVIEHDGRVMLVMEWIRGRTLDRLLADGPLPWRRAANLGAEMAEALESVHAAGLVHRDFKPGNVMQATDGHLKVMDFGVALHVFRPAGAIGTAPDTTDRLTAKDRRVGTVRYMSPEQLRGEAIDARSDLFALGIVLWELLTGSHPFLRPTTYETATAILNELPGSESDPIVLPETPRLREVVLRLLEKDPAKRYASAAEAAAELRSIGSSTEALAPATERPAASPNWRGLTAAAAILVALAATALGVRTWRARGGGTPPRLPVVAVLPFEDRDAGPGSLRGAMVASLASAGLSESRAARPVDLERVVEAYGANASGRDIAAHGADRVRAGWVVAGQLWTENATVVGTVRIYRAGMGEPVVEHPLRAGGPSGLAAIVAARTLEAVAPGYHGDAATLATKSNVPDDAREQLVRARSALRAADYAAAIGSLESAVQQAPGFAEARTLLASALYGAGWGRRSREEAARALKDAEAAGASIPPRVPLESKAVSAHVNEKTDDELAARRTLVERYRDDPALLAAYADVLRAAGKYDEALGVIAQAEALDPEDVRTLLTKARILTAAARYDDANTVLAQAGRALGTAGSAEARGRVAMQQGQVEMTRAAYPAAATHYTKAEGLFREAQSDVFASRAHRSALDAAVVQGKLSVGARDYEPALNVFRAAGALQDVVDTLNVVGGRDLLAGEYAEAEPRLRAAIQEGRILENPGLLVYPQLNLAALLNMTSRSSEAEGLATEAVATSRALGLRDAEAFALSLLAQAEAMKGRLVEARDAYRGIAQLARAPGSTGEGLGFALMGEADLDDFLGLPTEGLLAADGAVTDLRSRNQTVELTSALIVRAHLRSQVTDWDGAREDLAEAEKLAAAAGAPVEDQKLRLAVARAGLLLRLGRWDEAARGFEDVRRKSAGGAGAEILAPATIGACHARLEQEQLSEADRTCRAVESDPRSMPNDRAAAHALLGEIELRRKRHAEAEQWARRAAGEARAAGMAPTELRALSVLVGIPGLPDRGETLRRGEALLKAYLDGIAEPRREAVRGRADWKTELTRFEGAVAAD